MHRMVERTAGAQRAATSTSTTRVRTCIATRTRHPEAELLRLTADPADSHMIVPDPRRRAPGRGAWITPTLDALDLAEKRRAIARALKVSAPVDTSRVRAFLEAKDPVRNANNKEKEDRTLMSTR